tara:strand:+ start:158 stop:583 length:426 start_codon:yes stop_codon:yes gene_type:complete
MSRARELSRLGNANIISADSSLNVGFGTTTSIQYKLDVVGDANFSGVVTATSFGGDGSGLTGVSAAGIGTELDSTAGTLGNLIYKTPRNYAATGVSSIYINSDTTSGDVAFTRLGEIHLGVGVTLHIGAGTTMIMNVLNLF